MEVKTYTMELTLSKSSLEFGEINTSAAELSFELYFGKVIGAQVLPSGGATGEALVKKSATDYDTEWKDVLGPFVSGTGGNSAQLDGTGSAASGTNSVAEGVSSKASGWGSHSEGYGAESSGYYSHSEGVNSKSSGYGSHTEGYDTESSGYYSHSEGVSNKAQGYASHSEGTSNTTNNDSEHAEGRFNTSHSESASSGKTQHSVGIGTSNSDRKNAFEIMQNGDVYVYGISNYDGTNPTPNVNNLQTIINNKESVSNKAQTLSESTTQYPSCKAVKDETDALDERIDNISTIGRFLSTWNAATGLPTTNPTTSPYTYKKGDYYIVGLGVVEGKMVIIDGVNYYPTTNCPGSGTMRMYAPRNLGSGGTARFCDKDVVPTTTTPFYDSPYTSGTVYYPTAVSDANYALIPYGTSYVSGVASTTQTVPPINVNDIFIYDGVGSWIYIGQGAKEISWGSIVGTLSDQTDLQTALTALDKVFIATFDETSYADVLSAYNAGKAIIVKYQEGYWFLISFISNEFYFTSIINGYSMVVMLNASGWNYDQSELENIDNRQTAITDSDFNYPTSGAVIDYAQKKLVNSIETFTIAVSDWSSMSGNEPFAYSAEVVVSATVGDNTILELINDQAVNFAKYGFAIGDTAGQSIKLFAMELPDASVTLKINIY